MVRYTNPHLPYLALPSSLLLQIKNMSCLFADIRCYTFVLILFRTIAAAGLIVSTITQKVMNKLS